MPVRAEDVLHRGKVTSDINRMSVVWKDIVAVFTVTGFWMIHALVKLPGHVKNRDQLMREAELSVDGNTITSHVKRIRRGFIAAAARGPSSSIFSGSKSKDILAASKQRHLFWRVFFRSRCFWRSCPVGKFAPGVTKVFLRCDLSTAIFSEHPREAVADCPVADSAHRISLRATDGTIVAGRSATGVGKCCATAVSHVIGPAAVVRRAAPGKRGGAGGTTKIAGSLWQCRPGNRRTTKRRPFAAGRNRENPWCSGKKRPQEYGWLTPAWRYVVWRVH